MKQSRIVYNAEWVWVMLTVWLGYESSDPAFVSVFVFYREGGRRRRRRHVASMGAKKNACRILVRNPERKKPHRRPTRTSGNNSKMDLNEIWWEVVGWIPQDRHQVRVFVKRIMNFRVPQNIGIFLTSWGTINFCWTLPHKLVSTGLLISP